MDEEVEAILEARRRAVAAGCKKYVVFDSAAAAPRPMFED
jgi:hypothetical protein